VKLRMWLSYNADKWPSVLYLLGSLVDVVSNFFSLKNIVPVLSFTKVSVPDPKIFLIDPDPRGQLNRYLRIMPDPVPTCTFLMPLKKICCQIRKIVY
jgi:hypothetical protein